MTLTIPKRPVKMEWFEEDEFAKCIFEMMQCETELERAKQSISLKGDFSLSDAYGIFDLTGSGFITRLQFEEVFNLIKQYPRTDELELVMKRYDKDKDGRLSFSEFSDMILPSTEAYKKLVLARKTANKGGCYARGECFLRDTQAEFDRLLQLIIQTEVRSENLRHQLAKRKNFDINKAFEALDRNNKGGIVADDIEVFLISRGFVATPS